VLGSLVAGQVLSVALLAGCLALAVVLRRPRTAAVSRGSIVAVDDKTASRDANDTADPALLGSEERT
jgi:hypothetical protein